MSAVRDREGEVLERLRTVASADVYKQDVRAATLRRDGGGTVFAYLPEYVAAGGRAVATTLPVSENSVRTPAGAVPPFFAGLLPEGRRLTNLRRAVKTSADDELSLLLAVGSDTIGDVRVVPSGEAATAPDPVVQVKSDWRETRFHDVLADAGIVDPVALPGVQEKVSARVLSLPVSRAHERFILKLDPPEFPHLVRNEAFCLALAREARIPVVSAEVVQDADGRDGLLVSRFDRVRRDDGLVGRVACEDGCQSLGRWPADKYNAPAEDVVRGLASHCAAQAPALRELYRQFVFAWLTGNGDLHAKNLSILEASGPEWRVAPAYDLPSTVPYGDSRMALSIGGRTTGLSRRRWLEFAAEIGLPQRSAVSALDDLLTKTASLEQRLRDGALPFAPKTTSDWIAELRDRRRLASAA